MHRQARIPRKKTKPTAPSNTQPIMSPRVVPNTVFEEDDDVEIYVFEMKRVFCIRRIAR